MSEPTPNAVLQFILTANRRGHIPSVVAIADTLGCTVQEARSCCKALAEAGKLRTWEMPPTQSERSGVSSD